MATPGNLKHSQTSYDLSAFMPSTTQQNTERKPDRQESPYKQRWKPTSNTNKQIIHLDLLYSNNEYDDYLILVPRKQLSSREIKIQPMETTETEPYDIKKIILLPPEHSEKQEDALCLIENSLGQWFFEDNGERKCFPDIGELESVHCYDIDENAAALLIVGTENLALIEIFEDNNSPGKNDTETEEADSTTNDDRNDDSFENIPDTALSTKNNDIQKWVTKANPKLNLHDNEQVFLKPIQKATAQMKALTILLV